MAVAGGTLEAVLMWVADDGRLVQHTRGRVAGDLVERDVAAAIVRLKAGERVYVHFYASNVPRVVAAFPLPDVPLR